MNEVILRIVVVVLDCSNIHKVPGLVGGDEEVSLLSGGGSAGQRVSADVAAAARAQMSLLLTDASSVLQDWDRGDAATILAVINESGVSSNWQLLDVAGT